MKRFVSEFLSASGSLAEHWYAVCLEKVLKNAPLSFIVFDIPIVVWRNTAGQPIALLDRCCHRNAPLSKGKIIDNSITCPYHGWSFGNDGGCVNIPTLRDQELCKKYKVQYFEVRENHGLIWVWMGDGPAVTEPFEMPLMKNEKGWGRYYMQTDFENNVTDLAENFMDVPHTVFVHKGWFRDEKKICVKLLVERTDNSVCVTYEQPNDQIGFFFRLINPSKLKLFHTDKFYLPNTTRVDYIFGKHVKSFIITSSCTPVSDFKTRVFTLISYKLGWWNIIAKFFLKWYTRQVITQDVDIMKLQGDNLKRFGEKEYRSTPADILHNYIESLRDWETGGKKPPAPINKTNECEIWI